MNVYKVVSLFTSVLFLYLFVVALFFPGSFFIDVGVEAGDAAYFITRRAAMFMLGIAVLLFSARNLQPSHARQCIVGATAVTMSGLAIMGTYEFLRGFVDEGIFMAIGVEFIVAVVSIVLFIKFR
jgi:peptidoglycan/LPS O-acetylase OafA/YrhL